MTGSPKTSAMQRGPICRQGGGGVEAHPNAGAVIPSGSTRGQKEESRTGWGIGRGDAAGALSPLSPSFYWASTNSGHG